MMRWLRVLPGALCLLAMAVGVASAESNGAGITAVYQGTNDQLEVFWIDAKGGVRDVWKDHNGPWHPPFNIAPPGSAPAFGSLTAVQQVQDDQLQVYWAGGDGALNIAWKSHNGAWHGPSRLSGPGFATPGSPLAAVWQPVRHEMHIFGLGADGRLNFAYNKDLKWAGSFAMTGPNFGVPGEQIAAVYQPEHEHLEVFAVGPNGAINVKWKAYDGKWEKEGPLTGAGAAPVKAALSAVYQPLHAHLEVFFIAADGSFNTLWKANDGGWSLLKTSAPSFAPPGAPLSAAFQSLHDQLEVFAIGKNGAVNDSWKASDASWNPPGPVAGPNAAPPGGAIKAVYYPNPKQLEVFWQAPDGSIWDVWKADNGAWRPPFRLALANGDSPYNFAACTQYFRTWFNGGPKGGPQDLNMESECQGFIASLCRQWQLGGNSFYLDRSDARILVLTFYGKSGTDMIRFGGGATWGRYYPTNRRQHEYGRGDSMSGSFSTSTGEFGLRLALTDPNDEDFRGIYQHFGKIYTVGKGGAGGLIAGLKGYYSDVNTGDSGSWYAPAYGSPSPVVCFAKEVTVSDVPPPAAATAAAPPPAVASLPKMQSTESRAPVLPAIPVIPKPAVGANFAGKWNTTVQNGTSYALTLFQDSSGRVNGSYSAGSISEGVVIGTDLYARWRQGTAVGTLLFSLASDRAVFAGIWANGETPPTPATSNGTWDGYRTDVFTGPSLVADFTGGWNVSRGMISFPLTLAPNQGAVSGNYSTGFANSSMSGQVARQAGHADTFSFDWQEPPTKGKGAFYLYPDGNRISGVLHSADKAYATWTGVRTSAGAVVVVPNTTAMPPPAMPSPPAAQAQPPPQEVAVVKIPRGACPGAEAVATQSVNVHDGIGGESVKVALKGGTLVTCIACDESWCLVVNANPHATVSRKFLDFDFATAQQPPPQQAPVVVAQQPPPVQQPSAEQTPAVADFSGEWHVISDKGWNYHITINQLKDVVSAAFVDQAGLHGAINGGADAKTFGFTWAEDGGYAGSGSFAMSDDGTHIDGGYQVSAYPPGTAPYLLQGGWTGTRGFKPFPAPAPVAQAPDPMGGVDSQIDYGGCGGCGKADVPDVVR